MRVERLDGPPFEKVQCQLPQEELSEVGWKGYRETRTKFNGLKSGFCMRHARWSLDGMKLCTQHAGIKALEELEVQLEVEEALAS